MLDFFLYSYIVTVLQYILRKLQMTNMVWNHHKMKSAVLKQFRKLQNRATSGWNAEHLTQDKGKQ